MNEIESTGISIKLWDYFVITLFLITSGATFWVGFLTAGVTFSFFFLVALVNTFFVKTEYSNTLNLSVAFIGLVIFLCYLNYVVYQPSYIDNSMVGYIVCMIGAYLVISNYDFLYFRRILTNIVYALTIVGIPVFLLFELGVLPTYEIAVQSGNDYVMFLIYTLGWPYSFDRFSGIWHEPGACQIILNTILWLYFDKFVKWNWEEGELRKVLVILIASLLTMSTGGYMVLMLLILAVVMHIRIEGRYKTLIYVAMLTFAVAALILMFTSPVVQNKLFNDDEDNVSKLERLSDILALWQMTLERPLLGYGIGSDEFWKMSDLYGNTACSTGILTYSASLGFPWLLVFIVFLWLGIRRMNYGKASIFLLIAILMMQFNEKFIEYPITNIFIFKFASYFCDEYDTYEEYDPELSID